MSNLNLKHTPNEKPRTGRCAPKSSYGRKLHELPDVDIVDNYTAKERKALENRRTYKITVTKDGKKTTIFEPKRKKKKKKFGEAPQVIMRKYADDCRNEG